MQLASTDKITLGISSRHNLCTDLLGEEHDRFCHEYHPENQYTATVGIDLLPVLLYVTRSLCQQMTAGILKLGVVTIRDDVVVLVIDYSGWKC